MNFCLGIYAGIVMVEKKISEVMAQQRISPRKLTDQQWQALVALHRTYIQEHHDYFLASQYYSAPPSLKEEASKQAMPARLWRHGIQNFLELLRRELPASLEHMLSFIALAYANMTLLRESVPRFEDTWVEYLGDLARHRMAISERPDGWKAWNAVATMWYQKAADISPGGGRIQRHLGVVARPNIIQQLFYHSKALVSAQPSPEARDSILHVVDLLPLPGEKCQHEKDLLDKDLYPTVETLCLPGETGCQHYPAAESALVKAAGLLASRGSITACDKLTDHFLSTLDEYIGRTKFRFRVQGVAIASTLCACLLDFGHTDSFLWKLLVHGQRQFDAVLEKLRRDSKRPIIEPQEISHLKGQQRRAYLDTTLSSTGHHKVRHPDPGRSIKNGQFSSSEDAVVRACHLFQLAVGLVLTRVSDKNILPFAHVILAFLVSLTYVPWALFYIEEHVPWASLVHFLNNVARSGVSDTRFEKPTFPQNHGGTGRQLPEDFMMRGLAWASNYHPDRFFEGDVVDEDERTLELPSHAGPRTERCLWLGVQLSLVSAWVVILFSYRKSTE